MPQPPILKVSEIFASVQGEGLRQGEPTIFVRLTGCNLRCDFCDTKYAWEGGDNISVQQVIEQVKQQHKEFPADWVCITGGEPLLQDIRELAQKIKREDLRIQIETNGTRFQKLLVDWYTVSPKPDKYGRLVYSFTQTGQIFRSSGADQNRPGGQVSSDRAAGF